MKKLFFLSALAIVPAAQSWAVDLYGATPTAHSISLSGIYLGSHGATDALASNPAGLTFINEPSLEVTALAVFSGGTFRNSTPYQGYLDNGAAFSGSAGFGMLVPGTRLHIGAGIFPTAMLAGKWQYADPAGTAGVSYGLQTNKSAFLALQSSIGGAYDISRHVSVGASFGIVNNINTLETPYIFQQNPTLAGLKALLHLHTTGVGYNGTLGTIISPTRSLQIGLSYKTRTTVRSTGLASGNMSALLQALGLSVQSTYHYQAEVDNVFPQSATAALDWQTRHAAHLYAQADWINWRNAFTTLPVRLTNGDNPLLNSLLGSNSLNDGVPLHWRNQVAIRGGFSLPIRESFTLEGGYAHTTNPVPSGTLTPLTAAIMADSLSTGLQYRKSRYRVQLGYQVNLPTTESVGASRLLAGEYNNSSTRLWLQTIAITTGIRF